MRIKVDFETENPELPIEYRRKFLSYLKGTIQDYNLELFDAMYGGGNSTKSFCSSVYFLPEVIIEKEGITLNSKRFTVRFTTPDVFMGVHLINAFMARRNKWFSLADYDNKLKVVSICKLEEQKINGNTAMVKILSPIIVRDHSEETGKDWYLVFGDEDFERVLKRNLKAEVKTVFGRDVSSDIDALKIIPVNLKKTVVKNYGIFIPCTIGSMAIEGETYLLEYLYKAGIGSRRSMAFGYIEVI